MDTSHHWVRPSTGPLPVLALAAQAGGRRELRVQQQLQGPQVSPDPLADPSPPLQLKTTPAQLEWLQLILLLSVLSDTV